MQEDVKRVLVIDDDPANLTLARAVLEAEGFEVEIADSGPLGLELIPQFCPHLLLLDVNMPRLSGMQTLEKIRGRSEYISVIFVSARSTVENVVEGLDKGADDYLRKPYDPRELCARVRAQIRIKELKDELKIANDRLQALVDIDDLTGLYNMRSIYERIENELARNERSHHRISVIMLDMDSFKSVNDNHDHLFGSYVLQEVGGMIKKNLRKVDFAARYGGDEFLIVLTDTDPKGSAVFCDRLREKIEKRAFKQGDHSMRLTASFGFAVTSSEDRIDARALVRSADRALYVSKEQGRNCIHMYNFKDRQITAVCGSWTSQ